MGYHFAGFQKLRVVKASNRSKRTALRRLVIEGLEDRSLLASVILAATPTTIFEGGLGAYQSLGIPTQEPGFTRIDYVIAVDTSTIQIGRAHV